MLMFLAAEKKISQDLSNAMLDLFSVYFTFNMLYPSPLYPVLLFLQHHVLNIKDQHVPVASIKLLQTLH